MLLVVENQEESPARMLPLGAEATLVSPASLREAQRYFPNGTSNDQASFAQRQLRARRRAVNLLEFYGRYRCHLSHLHLLAACAVALGRFAGLSAEFDEMGEEFMPVCGDGSPRTELWKNYVAACVAGRPWAVRDELWLAAHMKDMEGVRSNGLEERFQRQAAAHSDDPMWQIMNQHVEATLGTRLMDRTALEGTIAYETAFAHSLAAGFSRLCTASLRLVRRYWWEGFRAVLGPGWQAHAELASYRRLALHAAWYSVTCWNAFRVYRRGLRQRERGRRTSEEGWPLLADVLGSRISEVHPLIVLFYQNPARFQVKVQVDLYTMPAKVWSRVVTLLLGQGLYEGLGREVDAQFRVFRRRDGSMHFLRELYVGETLRVFDSDFVVRQVDGAPTLFEVFVDKHIAVEMSVTPLPGRAVRIRGTNIYFRGVRVPCPGLRVEFVSRVVPNPEVGDVLHIEGQLLMQPDSRWGHFLMCNVLRRPEVLGTIRYLAHQLPTIQTFQ